MNLRNKNSIEDARRHISGSSNQSEFPEDNKLDRPIRLLWQDQQVVRTNQSSYTDHLSVLANQILQTDLPTDHLSSSANQTLKLKLLTRKSRTLYAQAALSA